MNRRLITYLLLIGLTILGITYAELTKPKEINWFPSYSSHHKIPFGAYIFNELSQSRFDSVVTVSKPPYEYLNNHEVFGTYLFFNEQLNFGQEEWESLLAWASEGNTLFLASTNFSSSMLDTLHLETATVSIPGNYLNTFRVALTHPDLISEKEMVFDKASTLYHFSEIDTSLTRIAGVLNKYEEEQKPMNQALVNMIRQPFGDGEIILSTFPQGFTNYFILSEDNKDYTAGLLSYVKPNKPLYLDAYYKSGKTYYASPLYLLLNNAYLKWSYYLLIAGALLYIVFEGKRKQRAIPVMAPLKNQTVDYTRTIANMYYEKSAHTEIAQHKIQHLLSFIREHMHLQTSHIDAEFLKQLAARSNNEVAEVRLLFDFIKTIEKQRYISKEELQRLNKLIEQFKSNY